MRVRPFGARPAADRVVLRHVVAPEARVVRHAQAQDPADRENAEAFAQQPQRVRLRQVLEHLAEVDRGGRCVGPGERPQQVGEARRAAELGRRPPPAAHQPAVERWQPRREPGAPRAVDVDPTRSVDRSAAQVQLQHAGARLRVSGHRIAADRTPPARPPCGRRT
jgi:hypothetical protein